MRVALIGGTGFVGSYVVEELLSRGHSPTLLVRRGSEAKVRQAQRCRLVTGTLDDEAHVRETVSDADAVIYLVGILREDSRRGITFDALQRRGAERAIDIARESGVRRFALMSANGVHANGTPYQTTKWHAERHLESSGLAATVLRPSVVFGDPRGRTEFCTQLRDQMILPPLPAPLFFNGFSIHDAGRFLMSPVYVGNVARVLVAALEAEPAGSETHLLCGPEALEWREIIERIAGALGRRKLAIPAPAGPLRLAADLLGTRQWFPITRDQIDMLLEGNTGDSSEVFARFGIEPTPFDSANLAYLR